MIRFFLFTSLILILNLAIGSGYDFGTKVMPDDTDMGKPLFDLPGGSTIGFWDTGTPGYDQADPVYLHVARSYHNMITPNDVRLTSIGNHSPGSKVTFEDIDMNRPLIPLPATINYLNLYGSSAYDLDDPVYLHQYYYGSNNIDAEQEQNTDEFSYRRHDEEADTVRIEDFEMRLPYRGGTFIFTNDIRLNRIGNLSPGTKVMDFDPDQNKILAIPALARFLGRARDTARIRYLDKNGNNEYDYPDYVYLNYPSGRTGDSVVVNNVRLTPVNASPGP